MKKMSELSVFQTLLTDAKLVGSGGVAFSRVHSDSRTIEKGDLFLALSGDRFDGSIFFDQALSRGAVAIICQNDSITMERLMLIGLPGLCVPNVKLALRELASGWRKKFDLSLIAVTGSNGKTTVTQMIGAVFKKLHPDECLVTEGNLNNDIGLSLTLLRLRHHHRRAVVELGMNHPGEIAPLAAMAQPKVALLNNAQREHLEFMGTVQAVAEENGKVIESLPSDGTAVFPLDDVFTTQWLGLAKNKNILGFGVAANSKSMPNVTCLLSVWSHNFWRIQMNTPIGPLDFNLYIPGLHNVRNAMAATAGCLAIGLPLSVIAEGLQSFRPVKGRSQSFVMQLERHQILVVDDTYNANPDSVKAAIEVLAGLPSPRLLVLGDMGEVGDQGEFFHWEVGVLANESGIESIFTLGEASKDVAKSFKGARHFEDITQLHHAMLNVLPQTGSLLVKGSRFMKMERVLEGLTNIVRMDREV